MNSQSLLLPSLLALVALSPQVGRGQGDDDAAIRDLQARQAEAWNRHDATAYANLFVEDGDVVNVLGWQWRGRMAIERNLSDAFAYVFRDSTLKITDVAVRHLDKTIVVAHVRWEMEGAKAPPGAPAPPNRGIQIQVLRKIGDDWRIVSFQNTNSVPEAPFPRSAPSVAPARQ